MIDVQDNFQDPPPASGSVHAERAAAADAARYHAQGPAAVKDPQRLLKPAKILLLIGIGLGVIGIGSNFLELQFFRKVETGAFLSDAEMMAAAESNDLRQMIVAIPQLVVLVLTFVFVGRWIYHSAKNVRLFGAVGLSIRPGWAVGWYFIPIANLWKPYQAMKEIWQASVSPENWADQYRPGLMPAWWTLWLISNVADRFAYRLSNDATTLLDFRGATIMNIASGGLNIALTVVFLMLITEITQLQTEARDHRSTVAVF